MRQPTPPKDSNRHAVPPEGKEGIIAHPLSARGLCYKEKKLILPKNLESFVLHRNIRGAVWRGRRFGAGRGRKKICNWEVGTTVGCYRGAQRWLETTGLFDGGCLRRRSLVADHRLHHEAVGHVLDGVAALRLALVDAWEGRQGRGDRGHCVKKTELVAANNPASTTTAQIAQAQ